MVKVGKLWGDAYFSALSPFSKLLYLYLTSQTSISTLGVLVMKKESILLDLNAGITGDVELDESIDELVDGKYLHHFKDGTFDVFIIKDHFLSLSKSKLNIRKAIDEGKSSRYRDELLTIYESSDFKPSMSFVPPTADEVTDYALSLGYVVNGKAFVDYYGSNDWYNKNNKKVRSWKRTLEKVWCREENRLKTVDGAPKGFEYFHIELESGERIFPEGWRSGRPTHSNYLHAELLNEEYLAHNN